MDEPPVAEIYTVTQFVSEVADEAAGDAVLDHERRMHIPPADRSRLSAIPFPQARMTDSQIARVREMLELGASMEEICLAVDQPVSVIDRYMAEFKPRWRRFLAERSEGD